MPGSNQFLHRAILGLLAIVLIVAGTYALLSDAHTEAEIPAQEEEMATIGDTIETNDADITVSDARISHGWGMAQPSSDAVFLIIEMKVRNTSSEQITLSIVDHFRLRDGDGRRQLRKVIPGIEGTLENEMAPGMQVSGELAWEVSPDVEGLRLSLQEDSMISGQAEFWIGDVEDFFE